MRHLVPRHQAQGGVAQHFKADGRKTWGQQAIADRRGAQPYLTLAFWRQYTTSQGDAAPAGIGSNKWAGDGHRRQGNDRRGIDDQKPIASTPSSRYASFVDA